MPKKIKTNHTDPRGDRIDLETLQAIDPAIVAGITKAALDQVQAIKDNTGIPFKGTYGVQAFAKDNDRGGSRVSIALRMDDVEPGMVLHDEDGLRLVADCGPNTHYAEPGSVRFGSRH